MVVACSSLKQSLDVPLLNIILNNNGENIKLSYTYLSVGFSRSVEGENKEIQGEIHGTAQTDRPKLPLKSCFRPIGPERRVKAPYNVYICCRPCLSCLAGSLQAPSLPQHRNYS